jgi:hypothetical protein
MTIPLRYGLFATPGTEGIEISGQTFAAKFTLKQMGAKWNAGTKTWVFPTGTDLSSLQLPPPPPPQKKLKKVFRTWVCGKKEARLDPYNPQGPMIWVCDCCGTYKSDYDGT